MDNQDTFSGYNFPSWIICNTVEPRLSELLLCEHPDYPNTLLQSLRNQNCIIPFVVLPYMVILPRVMYCAIAAAKLYTRQLAMANTDRKHKRVVLSIESTLTVLDSVAKGVGYSELTEKFGIGKSTITTLKKNEAKIREFASTLESNSMSGSRKVMRLAKDEELDRALYIWFVQDEATASSLLLLKRIRDLAASKIRKLKAAYTIIFYSSFILHPMTVMFNL